MYLQLALLVLSVAIQLWQNAHKKSITEQQPTLDAYTVQRSTYGTVIQILYGKNKISGNIIWKGNTAAVQNSGSPSTPTAQSGSGGGTTTITSTYWTYTMPISIGLVEGPIKRIGYVWMQNSNVIPPWMESDYLFLSPSTQNVTVAPPTGYTFLSDGGVWYGDNFSFVPMSEVGSTPLPGQYTVDVYGNYVINIPSTSDEYSAVHIAFYYGSSALSTIGMSLFSGVTPQLVPGDVTAGYAGQDLAYSNLAYVHAANLSLGTSNAPPNFTFEVVGLKPFSSTIEDSEPSEFLTDILTSPLYGAGYLSSDIDSAAMSTLRTYCAANSLFLSPMLTAQTQANSFVEQTCSLINAVVAFYDGKLKIIPFGDTAITGNGYTYTPNTTPVYDLTDDDFIVRKGHGGTASAPIIIERKSNTDCFNTQIVEYVNTAYAYNTNTIEAMEQSLVDQYGRRPAPIISDKSITSIAVAQTIAQNHLRRNAYIKNQYRFKLNWSKILIAPMDLVTLTSTLIGYNKLPVRVLTVEEDGDGLLSFTCEDFIDGIATPALFDMQTPQNGAYLNDAVGNINIPVMFEPPDLLTATGLELWIGASGIDQFWGGCNIWVSTDNQTYKVIGAITGNARQGLLSATLPTIAASPDQTNTLSVDLTESKGVLYTSTQADAQAFNTICYVDGELVAYGTATLTATNKYNLTYLVRGIHGTAIAQHLSGKQFLRLDDSVFKYPFTISDIGKQLYIKFTSYNTFGGGTQSLADVQPYQYTITGSALNSSLPNVLNLTTSYQANGTMQMAWDTVTDFRAPIIYEIRKGTSWNNSLVLGTTTTTNFTLQGDGTYWVSARYDLNGTTLAYSETPASISSLVETFGAQLPSNILQTWDEFATGWAGLQIGCSVDPDSGYLSNNPTLFDNLTDIDSQSNFDLAGDSGTVGGGACSYTTPDSHIVNIGYLAPCNVTATFSALGIPISGANISTIQQLSLVGDLAGASSQYVSCTPYINISVDGSTWQGWQVWRPGTYIGWKFKMQLQFSSTDPNNQTAVQIESFNWTIDMPDINTQGTNVSILSGGTAIAFVPTAFQIIPNIQITILNAVAGDDVFFLAGPTTSGFTVQIKNAGSGVARNVNWFASGY